MATFRQKERAEGISKSQDTGPEGNPDTHQEWTRLGHTASAGVRFGRKVFSEAN